MPINTRLSLVVFIAGMALVQTFSWHGRNKLGFLNTFHVVSLSSASGAVVSDATRNVINVIKSMEELTGLGTKADDDIRVSEREKKVPVVQSEEDVQEDEYTAPLLRDIELLSSLLGEIIKSENECVYEVC